MLSPEHLADLRASGLSDATIGLMRCEAVDPSDWLKSQGVASAYRIPYLQLKDCPPCHRDRLFFAPGVKGERKYDQPKGAGCRLYVLEPVVDLLHDFTRPIFFVEGEKKAVAGYQAGLDCVVGVGGIWNFLDKRNGELICEFDRIAFHNREIYYIPDSDIWARRDLKEACYEFGAKIQERGGLKFYFIQLSPKVDGAKQGLDDFFLSHSIDDLMKLPKITLGGKGWTLEKRAHKAREAKKKQKAEVESEEKKEEIPPELLAKALLTRDLIAAVENTIRRFVFIKDQRVYLLISLWTLATYVYEVFDYMPLLWVTSPTKRSGKTRLLEVLVQLVAKASGIQINPSEAIIFRITNRGATLILDEVEKLRKADHEVHGTVMAVLNSGFQKGATVARVRKGKDGVFTEIEYQTYGPKIISGISNVTDTIADRSLIVKLIRRVRATETLERFRLRKLAKELGDLKFQLNVWAAAKHADIQNIYDGITEEPHELRECDDRFLDIVEPLLAIASLADAEQANGGKSLFNDLVLLLGDLGTEREDTQGDAAIAVAIDTIGSILGNKLDLFVPSTDMLKAFQEKSATAWIKSARALATFLSKLDLRPKPDTEGERRGYYVSQAWFSDMKKRYSSSETSEAVRCVRNLSR